MDVFIGGICGSKLISNQSDIHANANFRLVGSHLIYSFVFVNNNRKSKITVMNNKGTNAYTIRNFRHVKKNAYTRIACVYFASALFAYLRAALYIRCNMLAQMVRGRQVNLTRIPGENVLASEA